VDWKAKRRKFPLGSHLNRARNKLSEYCRKNDADFDFNKNKTERNVEAMTSSKKKEVSTLRKFFRFARKKGFIDKVTEFEMAQGEIPKAWFNRSGVSSAPREKPSVVKTSLYDGVEIVPIA
jgi:site-specific recombinase XerD